MLNDYITKCSKMHYGCTLLQIRSLAYEYAKQLDCKYPSSWDKNNMAGMDWMSSFRIRNKNLSLRKPENTSAARSFVFNRTAVDEFFENYRAVLTKYKFTSDRIYNLDETGVTTLVSAERGELVTVCAEIPAAGHIIPPTFVFPRVHYEDHFINDGAPEGSLDLATRSGWINGDLWLQVLKHVQKHTSCSKENLILLLCDNHESLITITAINYLRDHGKTVTIYDKPKLVGTAFLESFSLKNITSGFSKPGIWPFNTLAFGDDDFAACEIYQTQDTLSQENPTTSGGTNIHLENTDEQDKPSTSNQIPDSISPVCVSNIISPGCVRPSPKTIRKVSKKGKPTGKSRISTDTPEKNRLEELEISPKKPKKLVVEDSDSTSVSDEYETVDTSDDNIDVSDDSSHILT
ncbi:hypothetical protein JTB14_008836 [Gonioctena quinquepunctata]|nr:hypothetical protein JTB14_008836 [Gonioctena quinquepunctata]